mmetsp:Transcript_50405/g.156254  ORF Transcript_50405/g.156254 Transcript_50405/m.156254 type:complete len:504 (-) Transcript_50405:143-1654(-)
MAKRQRTTGAARVVRAGAKSAARGRHHQGVKARMSDAVKLAHEDLNLTSFVPVGGGSLLGQALYRRALEHLRRAQSEHAPKGQARGAAVGRGPAAAAIADAAGKEGNFNAMLARFSRRKVDGLRLSDHAASEALAKAVGGERQAQQGVAAEMEHAFGTLLKGLLGTQPPLEDAAEAAARAALAFRAASTADRDGTQPALSSTFSGALVVAMPFLVAELAAYGEALSKEIATLRAQVHREQQAAADLRRQRDEAGRELQAARRELAATSKDLQLASTALGELRDGQARQRGELVRKVLALLQATLSEELDTLGEHLSDGLTPACSRLDGGAGSLQAAGKTLDAAEMAARGQLEALAEEAGTRAEAARSLSERLDATQKRTVRAAFTAKAAASQAAEGLVGAATGLHSLGLAKEAAEEARGRLDEEVRRYRAGHAAALEEHHALVREGLSRGPLPGRRSRRACHPERVERQEKRRAAEPRRRGTRRRPAGCPAPADAAGEMIEDA